MLSISRGAVYYLPRLVSDADLALMRRIDKLHLEHPFMGARMLHDQLDREGRHFGRRHVRTLMLRMGIDALGPQPGTSKATPGNKIYPYLLRKLPITRANQVWALDTTLYLADVAIRYRRTRRGQHGHYVRLRAWDVDVAPRLTFAPIRDRTVAKASPCAMSLH